MDGALFSKKRTCFEIKTLLQPTVHEVQVNVSKSCSNSDKDCEFMVDILPSIQVQIAQKANI